MTLARQAHIFLSERQAHIVRVSELDLSSAFWCRGNNLLSGVEETIYFLVQGGK